MHAAAHLWRDRSRSSPWRRFPCSAGAALLAAGMLVGCVTSTRRAPPVAPPAPAGSDPRICYDCFWQYQPEGFRDQLALWYETHPSPDPLIDADRRYLLARVRGRGSGVCEARQAFEEQRGVISDPQRRLFLEESVAFTAEECGGDVGASFEAAAKAASSAGQDFKAGIYRELAAGRFQPEFGDVDIKTRSYAPPGATGYVLGESAIRVDPGTRIGVQVERTVRDWLSYQLAWDLSSRSPARDELIPWHEGARLKDILEAARAVIVPLPGTLVARRGDRWLAPDESGVFRFEVIPDKIAYPTTRAYGGAALLVDTHGIASLVESAIRTRVGLVVGCCDTPYKAQAAWWLAARGVDVYFPCDRQVGLLLGYEGSGTLIGSAPVRAENGQAVIGDRPIRFSRTEVVVVGDTRLANGLQYYDAPARYFRRLGEMLPLRLEFLELTGPGESGRIARRAREIGAEAIAVRVWNEDDADAVRQWLAQKASHRAVLFHTAAYPAGYALFGDFPAQTTFGDPRPRFLID